MLVRNYSRETGSMTGILEELNGKPSRNGGTSGRKIRLILLYKGLKGKARIPTVDLIPKTGVAEINTQWALRFALLVKMPIRKAYFPKLSDTGMTFPILSSPLLNCRTTAYLNSLPLWELGTNLPRPSPGEVLSILILILMFVKAKFGHIKPWQIKPHHWLSADLKIKAKTKHPAC